MIKLIDYIKECLKDKEFKDIWDEENADLNRYIFSEDLVHKSSNNQIQDKINDRESR